MVIYESLSKKYDQGSDLELIFRWYLRISLEKQRKQRCMSIKRGMRWLQAGRSRVRSPKGSLRFIIDLILLAALRLWGRLRL